MLQMEFENSLFTFLESDETVMKVVVYHFGTAFFFFISYIVGNRVES